MRHLAPVIIVALSCFASFPALGQGTGHHSACTAIDDDAARLACFDGLAALAADEAARADPGAWVLEEWPSRLNPAWTDYDAWTVALNPLPGSGGVPVNPVLALRCEQGETRVFFDFGRTMTGPTVPVQYRLGSGEIQPGELRVSPDGRRFGLWHSDLAVRFVKALYHSDRLRLQVPIGGGEPLTAAFELKGLAAAAAPMREACAWE